MDKEAIDKDERFDGYYAIQTNLSIMSPETILDADHTLWKIEESFRIMKSTLEVRPIFHWTEKRIKGHFAICFLAFLLERILEFRLKENNLPVSPVQIQEALNSLQFTEVEINSPKYLIKMRPAEVASKILRILHIATPRNITPLSEAKEFAW